MNITIQYFNKWFDVLFDKKLNHYFPFKKNIIRFFLYSSLNIYLQIFILSLRKIFLIMNNLILSKISSEY